MIGKTIETSRIEETTLETLKKWFNTYHEEVLKNSNISKENIYNMNESDFSIEVLKTE